MSVDWRRTRKYRIWRVQVIRRDKVCAVCGSVKRRQAHHKNSGAYFADERFNVENGITLCSSCHTKYHCDYHRSFREKCTSYDFDNFMSLSVYLIEVGSINTQKKILECMQK